MARSQSQRRRRRRKPSLKEACGSLLDWIKRLYQRFRSSYLAIYIASFAAVTLLIVLTSRKYYDEEFLKRVLAGAHGLILNMFVLGIIVYLLTRKGQKLAEIENYRDQIDNLRGLQTREVSRHLRMAIYMLNKRGVSEINLSNCHFEFVLFDGFDLSKSDFSGSYFDSVKFSNCNLVGAKFHSAQFNGVDFDECDLNEADFGNARLQYVNFSQCNLRKASFNFTYFNLVDLSWTDLSNIDFGHSTFAEVHLHKSDIEGAFFLWADFQDIDDLTEEQLSKVETLYGARFGAEFERRMDISRLKQKYPKLFEEPEWFEKRKPRYT